MLADNTEIKSNHDVGRGEGVLGKHRCSPLRKGQAAEYLLRHGTLERVCQAPAGRCLRSLASRQQYIWSSQRSAVVDCTWEPFGPLKCGSTG